LVTSSPSSRTEPARFAMIAEIASSSVVFPAPFAPTMAQRVPRSSATLTSCKTSIEP
jgi:hypothetical protein